MTRTAKKIIDNLAETSPEAKYPTGFSEAIVGIGSTFGEDPVFVLSTKKIIQILMKRDKMKRDEAIEYFDYNIRGAYVARGPFYMEDL